MKKIIITTVIATISYIGAFAQNASIEGSIKNTDSTSALANVSVYLDKTNIGTSTNASGNYVIKNVPEGNYTLVVSSIGYSTIKKEISVGKSGITKQDFIMRETISTLLEVTITGGSNGIRDIPGSVHYISPKEIQKFSYTDINRTLRSVPGVNVQEEDGFGLFPNIGLRGTGVDRNTKITVMEDGILMAPAPYAAPAAYYFPTIGRMQGIEIIKGSSQIKYGPYTTGGAINLISTEIPNEFLGKISLLGGSFGGRNLHAVVGNSHKNFAYMVETFQYGSNGFKQLDGAGKSYFSFELAKAFIDHNFKAKYFALEEGLGKLTQNKVRYYNLDNNLTITGNGTLREVRNDAKNYDLIVIDSFQKLNVKAEEFERLRQDFPKTIFIIIFQKTKAGTMRGGSSIKFNSSATIDVQLKDEERIAVMEKGRYGTIGWVYSIDEGVIIREL